MSREKTFIHPYIPNSAPQTKAEMLRRLGLKDLEELFSAIPARLKCRQRLPLPGPLSEMEVRRHVEGILARNRHCGELLNFRGAGCWQHYVPSVCDEILSRGEFLTAYTGSRHANLGSFQALFEFQSMLAELLEMDMVSYATYDWGASACSALSMACRITGRDRVLVAGNMGPDRRRQIQTKVGIHASIEEVGYEPTRGTLDTEQLAQALSEAVAALYVEVPSFFGTLETELERIAQLVHENGSLLVAGVDPISLGVVLPPGQYGADLACGSLQPLGVHMYYGGGLAGFLAMPDEEPYRRHCPWPLLGLLETEKEGQFTFGWSNFDTTSYGLREASPDFIGTGQSIWAIVAGVYLSLQGPEGMREVGENILARSSYAAHRLGELRGVTAPLHRAPHFKEFVVDFSATGLSVCQINAALLERGILGGVDLSASFPELGQAALYCVTELHGQEQIERLVQALREVLE